MRIGKLQLAASTRGRVARKPMFCLRNPIPAMIAVHPICENCQLGAGPPTHQCPRHSPMGKVCPLARAIEASARPLGRSLEIRSFTRSNRHGQRQHLGYASVNDVALPRNEVAFILRSHADRGRHRLREITHDAHVGFCYGSSAWRSVHGRSRIAKRVPRQGKQRTGLQRYMLVETADGCGAERGA